MAIKITGSAAPTVTGSDAGMVYYDSTTDTLKVYNGTSWETLTNPALGGTITTYTGYIVHTFTTSGVFISSGVTAVDYLVVAGGGSGGVWHAGGGGAGGVRTGTSFSTTAGSYTITVGAGGAGGTSAVGAKGDDSVFGDITAEGGGRGGLYQTTTPGAGGSGAGGNGTVAPATTFLEGADGTNGGGTFGTSIYQGHNGGDGGYNHGGGGGGGAGGSGVTAASATAAGAGGVGISTFWGMDSTNTKLLLDNADIGQVSGSSRYVAGGGGGGCYTGGTVGNAGAGGLGGGGRGSYNGNSDPPLAALDNMGAGGAGSGSQGNNTAYSVQTTGGTGVVIIRYPI